MFENIERQRDKQRYINKTIQQKQKQNNTTKTKTKTKQNKIKQTWRKLIPTKTWWTNSRSSLISTSYICHVTRVTNSMLTLGWVVDLYKITNLLGFFFFVFFGGGGGLFLFLLSFANTMYANYLSIILIGLLPNWILTHKCPFCLAIVLSVLQLTTFN